MVLKLHFPTCLVCNQDLLETRDLLDLDRLDEEGRRMPGWHYFYVLPPARMRQRLAPDICDQCWSDHRDEMLRMRRRRGHYVPRFHSLYLWGWVADQLAEKAKRMPKADTRLTINRVRQAERAVGTVPAGPPRLPGYGPRRFTYKRGIYG